jgi:hypothetical protein
VFRSAGFPLIDPSEWPEASDEDKMVQRELVAKLASSEDAEMCRQAKRIENEIGKPRIRPDHVAGACLEDQLPARYEQCEANAVEIMRRLDAHLAATHSASDVGQ